RAVETTRCSTTSLPPRLSTTGGGAVNVRGCSSAGIQGASARQVTKTIQVPAATIVCCRFDRVLERRTKIRPEGIQARPGSGRSGCRRIPATLVVLPTIPALLILPAALSQRPPGSHQV